MNSGMYSAVSGSLAAMRKMDVITNNLANVNTPGFKKDKMTFEGLLAGEQNPPAVPQSMTADPILLKDNLFIDHSSGPVSQTGNTLDVALDGEGFFVVTTPDGPAYTRQGNFQLSSDGILSTADGFPVAGQGGDIRIKGNRVEIGANGIITVDGTQAGTLSIVDFEKPYKLVKKGGTLFIPADPQAVPQNAKAQVRQGHLEGSNVDTVSEMVQLIENTRYFEASQKVIRNYDDLTAKAANELGRV